MARGALAVAVLPVAVLLVASCGSGAVAGDPPAGAGVARLVLGGRVVLGPVPQQPGGPATVLEGVRPLTASADAAVVRMGEAPADPAADAALWAAGIDVVVSTPTPGVRFTAGPVRVAVVTPDDPGTAATTVAAARASADVVVLAPDGAWAPAAYSAAGADLVWGDGPVLAPVTVAGPGGGGRPTVLAPGLGVLGPDGRGALLEVLVDRARVLAVRVEQVRAGRAVGAAPVAGDAGWFADRWWALTRPPPVGSSGVDATAAAARLRPPTDRVDLAVRGPLGDAGDDLLVIGFHRQHVRAPATAHLGVIRPDGREVWVGSALARPVAALAVCRTGLMVGEGDPQTGAVIAGRAWVWRGFGFAVSPVLAGSGRAGCADVDGDGGDDPVFVGRGWHDLAAGDQEEVVS